MTSVRLCTLLCAAFTVSAASVASAAPFELTVVHVNDTHSYAAGVNERGLPCYTDDKCTGGYARIASFIDQRRAEHANVLALDAGDAWQGTLFFGTGGEAFSLAIERAMPYDAVTLGNHEFDLGCDALAHYAASLNKPVVAANLAPDAHCPLSNTPIAPYRLFEYGEVTVAVVGLANDEVRVISKACPHTHFLAPTRALTKALEALKKEGVNHVIVLSHLGYDLDQRLAREVPGVDLFVGGHTHSILGKHKGSEGPYPTEVVSRDGSRTLVVQAGLQTRFAGSLTLRFDEKGRVTSYAGDLHELTSEMPRRPQVEAIVQRQERVVRKKFEQRLARVRDMGLDGIDYCREDECPTGLITADAMLAFGRPYGAEAALINGGAIRSALPVGEVSIADLQNIHPFGNRLRVIEMTGRQIRAALEHGLSDPDVAGPRLLQPAGIRYRVDRIKPLGKRLVGADLRRQDGAWRPLREDETVRVVVIDYLRQGGDAFDMIRQAAQTSPAPDKDSDETDLVALVRHIRTLAQKHRGELPPPEGGRILGMRP